MAYLIFTLVFTMLLVLFASQNTGLVTVRFLLWQTRGVSLAAVVIVTAMIGALAALLAVLPAYHRRRSELARCRQELDELRGPLH
jgi:uncharacterized integral membrane protein